MERQTVRKNKKRRGERDKEGKRMIYRERKNETKEEKKEKMREKERKNERKKGR